MIKHLKEWDSVERLPGDASQRAYTRLKLKGTKSPEQGLLKKDIPSFALYVEPSNAQEQSDFLKIAALFDKNNIRVPKIYEAHEDYLLIEDLGDTNFSKALQDIYAQDHNKTLLFDKALEILQNIQAIAYQDYSSAHLPSFWQSPVYIGKRRLVDWYIPAIRNQKNEGFVLLSYLNAWMEIENSLPAPEEGVVHVDFHAENLMYLEKENQLAVIDFQGAMIGPLAYDYGNLLEDMRQDVPRDIQKKVMKTLHNKGPDFLAWYRVLTTQFHCRLLGQCLKWSLQENKDQYLSYMPRLCGYIKNALNDPILEPLQKWAEKEKVDFIPIKDFNKEELRAYIGKDAY